MRYLLFHKPYGVLTQFTDAAGTGRKTLKDFVSVPGVYAAGRLDADSEGLLLLTDDGDLQHRLLDPKFGHRRTYWVQVEGAPSEVALAPLRAGVLVQGEMTLPAEASLLGFDPPIPPRDPPVRFRAAIPTTWISLTLTEGRNRQVRRMTAAIGFPTLRLVRWSMEALALDGLKPGEWRSLNTAELTSLRAAVYGTRREPVSPRAKPSGTRGLGRRWRG